MSDLRIRPKYVTIVVASGVGVAERWRTQYHRRDRWGQTVTGDSEAVYNALCALGPNPPIDKVAEIIGNKGWSYVSCDGCGDSVERAVSIGEYEPKSYCLTCIFEAHQVLSSVP